MNCGPGTGKPGRFETRIGHARPAPQGSAEPLKHFNEETPMAAFPAQPDLAAVKQRQQATWATGDFSYVAARIVFTAEQLAENADFQAGGRVLDVATASGNGA